MDCDIFPALPHMISPGAYLLPQLLSLNQQQWIVMECRKWANGPVPFHRNSIYGKKMSVQSLSLGWHWSPYKYSRNAINVNGKKVLGVPEWILAVYRQALGVIDDYSDFTDHSSHLSSTDKTANRDAYIPDVVLVNFYHPGASMGMHQDKEEKSSAPIVSLSVGDACTFRLGNTCNRNKPYTDIVLHSGDVVVFGGPARLAYHGVTKIHPYTSPEECGLREGRINLTIRVTGWG